MNESFMTPDELNESFMTSPGCSGPLPNHPLNRPHRPTPVTPGTTAVVTR
jgi:hypothetical protein